MLDVPASPDRFPCASAVGHTALETSPLRRPPGTLERGPAISGTELQDDLPAAVSGFQAPMCVGSPLEQEDLGDHGPNRSPAQEARNVAAT
jgi:hypothetical protein